MVNVLGKSARLRVATKWVAVSVALPLTTLANPGKGEEAATEVVVADFSVFVITVQVEALSLQIPPPALGPVPNSALSGRSVPLLATLMYGEDNAGKESRANKISSRARMMAPGG